MSEYFQRSEEYIAYKEVAELDPLNLDSFMQDLPGFNMNGDVEGIRLTAQKAVYSSELIDSYSKTGAYAAIRDLDFLASSLIRHGENPIETVDGLEDQLLRLGRETGTVPRGTVFTYAAANPSEQRRRSFTGTEAEESFIDAVARSVYVLDGSVDSLSKVRLSTSNDVELVESLLEAELSMQQMVKSIISVKRTVSPEFFTNDMRPYFDSMTVGGKEYTGAGGAQMQLLALDYMLWGSTDESEDYRHFYEENYQYLTPAQRGAIRAFDQTNGEKNIVEYLSTCPNVEPLAKVAALDVLKIIKKFRYPHRRIAQEDFKLRSKDAVGSGNYRPDILDTLIKNTDDAIQKIEGSI